MTSDNVVIPLTETDKKPENFADVLADVVNERQTSLEKPRRSLQPTQIIGIIIFLTMILGGVTFVVLSSSGRSSELSAAKAVGFPSRTSSNSASMAIGEYEPPEPVAVATPQEPTAPIVDQSTLDKLSEMAALNSGLASSIDDLKRQLDAAEQERQSAFDQVAKLTSAHKAELTAIEAEANARITTLERSKNIEITKLQSELALALSTANGNESEEERRKRLAEQAQRQIESQGLIFDSSSPDQNGLKY
jgi:hypothetical protein